MNSPILIREMRADDALEVAALSGELGYPAEPDEIGARIKALRERPEHALFVACVDSALVGWIDVAIVHHLASPAFGEIGGLVVSGKHRSRGIGEQLVARAEEWIGSRGIRKVVVRSRTTRERAHQFYLRHGYSEWKRQAVFHKEL
ncbi:MAG TPA: GNAT family N-acetyltransferase [Bryobacteraceae bacterium]|jgi:GNAT superfamily N-acetyltransferase|nr:GNAT family N-acetyltransferase [Bryobacteraceae bacterium]